MSFILCRTVNEDVLFPSAVAASVWLLGVMEAIESDDTEKKETKNKREEKTLRTTRETRNSDGQFYCVARGGC